MSGSFFRTATLLLLIVTQSQPNLLKVQNMKSLNSPDFYLAFGSWKIGPQTLRTVGPRPFPLYRCRQLGSGHVLGIWAVRGGQLGPYNWAQKPNWGGAPPPTVKLAVRKIFCTLSQRWSEGVCFACIPLQFEKQPFSESTLEPAPLSLFGNTSKHLHRDQFRSDICSPTLLSVNYFFFFNEN